MDTMPEDSAPNRRRFLELGVTLSSFLAVIALNGCTDRHDEKLPASFEASPLNPEIKSGQTFDLLTDQTWSMAGVERRSGGLYVGYEGMRIVKKRRVSRSGKPAY